MRLVYFLAKGTIYAYNISKIVSKLQETNIQIQFFAATFSSGREQILKQAVSRR